ncbi:collagen-like protein, partial [Pyxidicoccus sp. 3LG]
MGAPLDLTTVAGFNSLAGRHHLQFTDITISGTLIVPSGTVLRATGNVTVMGTGTIIVAPAAQDAGNGAPNPGVALAPAGSIHGGVGLGVLQASHVRRPGPLAGGAGDRNISLGSVSGGEGGGSLVIVARGNVSIAAGGAINANGVNGNNPGGATDIPGPGGGGGGVIIIGAHGNITVSGFVRAAGGAGGPGVNGNGGAGGAGGGGGGGGGIIHLIAAGTINAPGSQLLVSGGNAGPDASSTSTNQPGSG